MPLIHDSTEVRAATLRTMRHLTKTKNDLKQLNDLHIPYLVTRCLDLELDNKVERLQALKLARNLAYISLSSEEDVFPLLLLRSIGKLISRNFSKCHRFDVIFRFSASIAECGKKEDDRLHRVALALLCEMSVINPNLFIESGGIKALNFCLLDTSMPKIAEAIISSLLRLHNHPDLRLKAKVNLGQFLQMLKVDFF